MPAHQGGRGEDGLLSRRVRLQTDKIREVRFRRQAVHALARACQAGGARVERGVTVQALSTAIIASRRAQVHEHDHTHVTRAREVSNASAEASGALAVAFLALALAIATKWPTTVTGGNAFAKPVVATKPASVPERAPLLQRRPVPSANVVAERLAAAKARAAACASMHRRRFRHRPRPSAMKVSSARARTGTSSSGSRVRLRFLKRMRVRSTKWRRRCRSRERGASRWNPSPGVGRVRARHGSLEAVELSRNTQNSISITFTSSVLAKTTTRVIVLIETHRRFSQSEARTRWRPASARPRSPRTRRTPRDRTREDERYRRHRRVFPRRRRRARDGVVPSSTRRVAACNL